MGHEMQPSDAVYQYQPLCHDSEIRLLKLHRSSSDQTTIGFSIIHVLLQDAPPYETVSYVWGEPDMSESVTLIDCCSLHLTLSAALALPHVGKASTTGFLWLDQICINQSDMGERNHQVTIMGKIYSRSVRCLIWINTDQSLEISTDIELSWGKGTGESVRRVLQSFTSDEMQQHLQALSGEEPQLSLSMESPFPAVQTTVRDHLLWFLEHEWFTRTWVFTEYMVSKQAVFIIGDFELPGHEIENVVRLGYPRTAAWFKTILYKLRIGTNRAMELHRAPGLDFLLTAVQGRTTFPGPWIRQNNSAADTSRPRVRFDNYEVLALADLLVKMGKSQASDNRDHVYAFIGQVPFLLKHMKVDYSLSVEESFASMMKAMIRESRSLDMFCDLPSEADISGSKLTLPSWVPNWTVSPGHIAILCHDNLFCAAGREYGLPWVQKCQHYDPPSSAWNELQVAGNIIDVVSCSLKQFSIYQVTPSFDVDFRHDPGQLPWESSTLNNFLNELADYGVSGSPNTDKRSLLRTLLMDGAQWSALAALTSGKPLYRTKPEVSDIPHYEKAADVIPEILREDASYDDLPHGTTVEILHELSKVQYRRRIVYCGTNKHFALVPDLAQNGDKIAIIHNSRTPLVLRLRSNNEYIIIGQCYYDGAMYGEMANLNDDEASIFKLI